MRQPPASPIDRPRLALLTLWVGLAAACLATGLWALRDTLSEPDRQFGPTAGGVLLLAGAIQLGLLQAARNRWSAVAALGWERRLDGIAWLLFGATVSLAGSLACIARHERLWVWLAAVAVIVTGQLALLVRGAMPNRRLPRSRFVKRAGFVLGTCAFAIWTAEGLLRVHDRFAAQTLDDQYALRAVARTTEILEPRPLHFHPEGVDAAPNSQVARRRVTLLGNRAALQRAEAEPLLDELTQRFPNVDWTCRGVIDAGPREYTLLAESASTDQPELLLLCVSAAADQMRVAPPADFFEPRTWKLYQAMSLICDQRPMTKMPAAPATKEGLTQELHALRACQLEPDPDMENAWKESRRAVARLVNHCQPRGIDVAIVIVPEAFQADPQRWQRVVNGSGLEPAAFDPRLPQHRWTTLAVDLGIPVVDLTAPAGASSAGSLATSRLAGWLDQRLGGSSIAPKSAVVSRQ